jgi:hypothetical protein
MNFSISQALCCPFEVAAVSLSVGRIRMSNIPAERASLASTIAVFGFPAALPPDWPPDLKPVPQWVLPAAGPLLVHSAAAQRFMVLSAALAARNIVQTAILYLARGSEAAAEDWRYFDETVDEGDWAALAALVACPRRFDAELWAQDVSVDALIGEAGRGGAPAMSRAGLRRAGVHSDAAAHLLGCATCRDSFRLALDERLAVYYWLTCPPPERLCASGSDEWVEAHLKHCEACRRAKAARRNNPCRCDVESGWLRMVHARGG